MQAVAIQTKPYISRDEMTDSFSPLDAVPKILDKSSSSSYDDNDYENYVEDRQYCYTGNEQNPEFTNRHFLGKAKKKEKSLKEDLKKANFPPIIISKAD